MMAGVDKPTTTWRADLAKEMAVNGDPGPVVAYDPDEASFDVEFQVGYGPKEKTAPDVRAWTPTTVYFYADYDGDPYLGSAPRNPPS